MGVVESAISWMEKTANDNSHGYDQFYRWGEYGDYDCSSAVMTAWEQAGIGVKTYSYNNFGCAYTGSMRESFLALGFKDVTDKVDLNTGAGLKRGDVLLNIWCHTAMYCGNGKEVEASINEWGCVSGGQAGDQTGREFAINNYRNYPWDCVLRYPEPEIGTSKPEANKTTNKPRQLCKMPEYVARVTASDFLAVRTYAGTEYPQIKSIPELHYGDLVYVCDTVNSVIGEPWHYVMIKHKTLGDIYGFCHSAYLEKGV